MNQDTVIDEARARNRAIAREQAKADKALAEKWAQEDAANDPEEQNDTPTPATTPAPIAKRTKSPVKAQGLSFPGVVLHAVGLEMPEGLPEAQADRILEDIGRAHLSLGWAVADALLYCERFGQASKYARASELTGLGVDTLRTYAWVARHVPLSIRIDTLSISHHRLVANKAPDVQSRYLLQASEQGLSVAALAQVIEADNKPAHTTLEEASRVLPTAPSIGSAAEDLADTLAQKLEEADAEFLFNTAQSITEPKQEEPEQEASEVLEVERVLDIERVTEDDPGGVVFGSRSGSQHFDYSQPNRRDPLKGHSVGVQSRGVPALAPGAPTLLPVKPAEAPKAAEHGTKPSEATQKPAEPVQKPSEATVKLGPAPAPAPRPKFVPNATDEIAEGVLRLGPVWFYRFEITVNGKLTHVNVMVSPHDTGNGLRWQATTDNGRGDVNTIPRTPLFTPHASREELEARLLAHFGKEVAQPGKEVAPKETRA